MIILWLPPTGIINILHDVPLNNTYEHSLYFSSSSAQQTYFNSKIKHTITGNMYTRPSRGVLRVSKSMLELIDCNYLSFLNSGSQGTKGFENKWFYCFITDIIYINNEVTEIHYEIDILQTFYFDYTLQQCFIERQHTVTDVIGENRVEEHLELGDLIYEDLGIDVEFATKKVIVASAIDANFDPAEGGLYGGVYSGLEYLDFTPSQANGFFHDLIEAAQEDKTNAVVSVFMFPSYFIPQKDATTPVVKSTTLVQKPYTQLVGGYVPRNKKLFTYPFNFLYVDNGDGNSAIYKYEDFYSGANYAYDLYGVLSCNPEFAFVPLQYKSYASRNWNEKLVLQGTPQCSWITDSFRAWLAQNKYRLGTNISSGIVDVGIAAAKTYLAGVGGAGADFYAGSYGAETSYYSDALRGAAQRNKGTLSSGFDKITDSVTAIKTARMMPAHANGVQSGSLNYATGMYGFHSYHATVRNEFARIIDDYFDRFGYAIHRNAVPVLNARPHWTYVKLSDCTMTGSIPFDVETVIKNIFYNGVTFWVNPSEVGNYSLDNSPSS